MSASHRALGALILAGAVAAGCKARESKTASTAETAAAPAAATPSPAPSRESTAAAPAPAALTDANIVYLLDRANAADSARGVLAEKKGTREDVRNFGRLMVRDHHKLRAEGEQLAKKLGVTPQAPAGDQSEAQAKQEMDSLTAAQKGPAWDKGYIDYEISYHKALMETATKALDAAQNKQLKDLIKRAAPVVKMHLNVAERLQKKTTA